ncbi:helix-turn-helix domain-containing protein, partial [Escherichia coli]|uniref:helix-turn-helix domain-containing protein n=4 Tax=Escherichia coli TaxID=562 RepID=UPI0024BDA7C1
NVRPLNKTKGCLIANFATVPGNVLQLSLPDIALPEPETPPAATVVAQEGEDEYQLIVRVLKETNGVVAGPKGAAQRLGLKRTTLLSRMKRLGIDKSALI